MNREQRLTNALRRLTEQSDFSDAWSIPGIKGRFSQLIKFFGGLASPFPNTEFSLSLVTPIGSTDRCHYLEGVTTERRHKYIRGGTAG